MDYETYKDFVLLKVLKAISSQSRLEILKILLKEKIISEQELVDRSRTTKQNINHHINILNSAHFVNVDHRGKEIVIMLNVNKELELNYDLLNMLKHWFAKKEGERGKKEKSFIESILTLGKISTLKNEMKEIEKKEKGKKKY